MRNWFRRSNRSRTEKARRPRTYKPRFEGFEERLVLNGASIDPVGVNVLPNVPANKLLFIPVTGADTDGKPLTYTVASTNSAVVDATVHTTGVSFVTISVANFGDMTFELFGDIAPNTVATIGGLIKSGFYNGLTFHRVVKGFVIQGGDPSGNGSGGPGFTFDDEFNTQAIFDGTGQLAMANSGRDTNGSQFFITDASPRNLDFRHTIFGQLIRGFDVLNAINSVAVDSNSKPTTTVTITKVQFISDTTDAVLELTAHGSSGSANITVTANDNNGGTAVQTFKATIVPDTDPTTAKPINEPAFLGTLQNLSTPTGQPITFTVPATDVETDTLTFNAVQQGTSHGTVTVSGNQITFTPTAGFTGPVQLLVSVADPSQLGSVNGTGPDTELITLGVGPRTITSVAAPDVAATEGSAAANVTVATFVDSAAGAAAADYTASINWGDDHIATGTVTADPNNAGHFIVTGTNTYKDAGKFPVKTTITLSSALGGNVAVATGTATVADVPLTGNPPAQPLAGTANRALSNVTVASFTDANSLTSVLEFTATINWGDGTTPSAGAVSLSGGVFVVQGTHTYPKDSSAQTGGVFTVTTTIVDNIPPGEGTATPITVNTTATIAPAAITATGVNVSPTEGTALTNTVVATFTDSTAGVQASRFTASIAWGDGAKSSGTVTLNTSTGRFDVAGTHTYAEEGKFTVSVAITDTGTPSDTAGGPVTTVATADGIDALFTPAGQSFSALQGISLTTVVAFFSDADAGAKAANYVATIHWGDGTTSLGTVTGLGKGGFQIMGTHTYALSGAFAVSTTITENDSANDPTFVANGTASVGATTSNSRYLDRLFHDILNRAPSAVETNFYSSLLAKGTTFQAVAALVERSIENLYQEVNRLYELFLHHEGDHDSLTNSVMHLLHGHDTLAMIASVLAGSDSYFSTRGNSTNDGFIDALALDLYGHTIDAASKAQFTQMIQNGNSRSYIASLFQQAREHHRVVSAQETTTFLKRTVQPVEQNLEINWLDSGATADQLEIAMASLPEYILKAS
jgi:cyclophilin family peptidyl-prolyl cis-trans isomerase